MQLPAAPQLAAPEDGAVFAPSVIAAGIELQWSEVPNAASYRVNTVVNGTLRAPIVTTETSTILNYLLEEGDEILWAVQALSESGLAGLVSAPRSIIVQSSGEPTSTPTIAGGLLPAPEPVSPANGEFFQASPGDSISVQFEWNAAAGAAYYQLSIERNGAPLNVPQIPALYTTLTVPISVTGETTVIWSVAALDADGVLGQSSESRTIYLGTQGAPTPTVSPSPVPTETPTPTPSITPTPGPIAVDVTKNGTVDIHDVFFMMSRYWLRSGDPGYERSVDLDGDFRVDQDDLVLFIEGYRAR